MSLEQNTDLVDISQPSEGQITIGLAWIGYFAAIPTIVLYVVVMVAAYFFLQDKNLGVGVLGVYAFGVGSIIYQVMLLRSIKLIINNNGVWAVKGILPWKKSCVGLQWRNIGVASFSNSLFTWIFKAYTINIEDRYTGAIELSVKNLAHGKMAVSEINRILSERHVT